MGALLGKKAFVLLMPLWLAGCTSAWSLAGGFDDKGETIKGSASRYSYGGTIELFGDRGTHCTGSFGNGKQGESRGTLLCDDRRMGTFSVMLQAKKGWGELRGRAFNFKLGHIREMRS